MVTNEQKQLLEQNVEAAQGDVIVLHAHSDTPASVSWSSTIGDYDETFTGDWSKTVESPGDSFWMVSVTTDDFESPAICSVNVDGTTVDHDQSSGTVFCMQRPETYVQDQ